MKAAFFLALLLAFPAAAAGQADVPQVGRALSGTSSAASACKSSDPNAVVVCGRSQNRYRIDPDVLAATRAAEALPPKPPLDGTVDNSCTGANCGGGTIPLVGMALTALKAAELAIEGDDWREAFRTRPDQYKVYEQSRAAENGRIRIGVTAGNK